MIPDNLNLSPSASVVERSRDQPNLNLNLNLLARSWQLAVGRKQLAKDSDLIFVIRHS
jgi:hypothetical protein